MLQMSVGRSGGHRAYMRLGRTIAGGSLDNTILIGDANGSNTRNTNSFFGDGTSSMASVVTNFLDSPATTSAVTYGLYHADASSGSTNALYINRGAGNDQSYYNRTASTITLMEVSA